MIIVMLNSWIFFSFPITVRDKAHWQKYNKNSFKKWEYNDSVTYYSYVMELVMSVTQFAHKTFLNNGFCLGQTLAELSYSEI